MGPNSDHGVHHVTNRILIADDDDDVRLLLRVVLGHEADFEIVGEAATPDDALALATQHQPHAIIIDHEFRGYATGAETAPLLRRECPETIIVMFSAYDALRSELQGSANVDAFVLKTDIMTLPATVRTLLQKPNSSPQL
jgi:DNA-binding NarL/FixJ family response regulator